MDTNCLLKNNAQYEDNGYIAPDDNTVNTVPETAVYPTRWYIIIMFSLMAATQGCVWSTYGPIADSAKAVYGWSDFEIGMFMSWGNIGYLFTAFLGSWVIDVKGLRLGVVGCAGLVVIGAGLRCIPVSGTLYTWIVYLGCIISGIAGTVPFSGPSTVAAVWFPMEERTVATAIATIFGYLGSAASFLIGPLMVKQYLNHTSSSHNSSIYSSHELLSISNSDPSHIKAQKTQIERLLYVELAWSALIFLIVLIYFPSRPPKPPTLSAASSRLQFKKGLYALVRNRRFWLALVAYFVPQGVYGVWSTLLDQSLEPIGISQSEAGWLGFYSLLGGAIAALFIGWLADKKSMRRHLKVILLVLLTCAICCVLWFCLIVQKVIPLNNVQLYISTILGAVFLNGSIPIFYEITVESCYPIAEGITIGVMTFFNNLAGVIFLMILIDKSLGTMWMNWVYLGSIVISIPPLLLFKEQHGRSAVDTHE